MTFDDIKASNIPCCISRIHIPDSPVENPARKIFNSGQKMESGLDKMYFPQLLLDFLAAFTPTLVFKNTTKISCHYSQKSFLKAVRNSLFIRLYSHVGLPASVYVDHINQAMLICLHL